MNIHFQLSANSYESPIRDRVLVLRWLDEVVIDVENLRDAHLIALVCRVVLEAIISARRVGEVSKGDMEIGVVTSRLRRIFTSTGNCKTETLLNLDVEGRKVEVCGHPPI